MGTAMGSGPAATRRAVLSRRAALRTCLAGAGLATAALLAGCVDQHPRRAGSEAGSRTLRIVATSPATAEICDKLDLALVGVPTTSRGLPERYADVKKVGTAMAPDLEILKSLDPDYVISPNSLQSDLQPKYAGASIACIFVDLKSVRGLYESAAYLGRKFDREEQASALLSQYESYMKGYRALHRDKKAPRVLVLMGVPGSYVVATPQSYAGSLVELAGGENVYADEAKDFVNANTEDMLARDPDIILRTAHALPQQVMQMFAKEFKENDIWRHFRAVKEDRVFDLDSSLFGMSAEFNYPDALDSLQPMLYGGEAGSDGTAVLAATGTSNGNGGSK